MSAYRQEDLPTKDSFKKNQSIENQYHITRPKFS